MSLTSHQIFELACLKHNVGERSKAALLYAIPYVMDPVSLSEPLNYEEQGTEVTYDDVLEADDSFRPDAALCIKYDSDLIQELLSCLTAREKRLIYLTYYADLNNEQIAEDIGVNYVYLSKLHGETLNKMRDFYFRRYRCGS